MKNLIYISLLFLAFSACRKDSETLTTTNTTHKPTIEIIEDYEPIIIPVTASVYGKVFDEAGNPVIGASVILDTKMTTTDEMGHFLFVNETMNAAGTYVEVQQVGYVSGSCRFFPNESSQNYATIRLLSNDSNSSFIAAEGGMINIAGGVQIEFQTNSIIDANGNEFQGQVTVFAKRIGPEEDQLPALMPGNLQGINWRNEDVALATYGLLAVELTSSNGELLYLDETKEATLIYQIFDAQLDNAPSEIALWYFNKTYGLWHEQGKALLEDGRYVGAVKKLSFINMAVSYPAIKLSGRLVNISGAPIANMLIRVNDFSTAESGHTYSDNNGFFNNYVPAGEELNMNIPGGEWDCNSAITILGNYADDVDLQDILIGQQNSSEWVVLTGTIVDCDNEPVNQSLVSVTSGGETLCYYQVNSNEIEWAIPNCKGDTLLSVQVLNLEDFQQSEVLEFGTNGPADLGVLSICNTVPSGSITINLEGQPEFIFLDASVMIDGDSIYLEATAFDTLSINLGLSVADVGDFSSQDVIYFLATLSYAGQEITVECSGNCGFPNGFIEIFGTQPEDQIYGMFSGLGLFFDNSGSPIEIAFNGTFDVYVP